MAKNDDPNIIAPNGLKYHKNNANLKGQGVSFIFTKEQIEERFKCTQDPLYFIEKYMKIVHVDKGLVPFEMYDFQKTLLQSYIDNRFTIAKLPRQVGKCVSVETDIVLRYKKKYVITVKVGQLYEIAKTSNFEELLNLSKSICEEYEKRLLLANMQS